MHVDSHLSSHSSLAEMLAVAVAVVDIAVLANGLLQTFDWSV
jgi:hypothetical protein